MRRILQHANPDLKVSTRVAIDLVQAGVADCASCGTDDTTLLSEKKSTSASFTTLNLDREHLRPSVSLFFFDPSLCYTRTLNRGALLAYQSPTFSARGRRRAGRAGCVCAKTKPPASGRGCPHPSCDFRWIGLEVYRGLRPVGLLQRFSSWAETFVADGISMAERNLRGRGGISGGAI